MSSYETEPVTIQVQHVYTLMWRYGRRTEAGRLLAVNFKVKKPATILVKKPNNNHNKINHNVLHHSPIGAVCVCVWYHFNYPDTGSLDNNLLGKGCIEVPSLLRPSLVMRTEREGESSSSTPVNHLDRSINPSDERTPLVVRLACSNSTGSTVSL